MHHVNNLSHKYRSNTRLPKVTRRTTDKATTIIFDYFIGGCKGSDNAEKLHKGLAEVEIDGEARYKGWTLGGEASD
jgi:hypothetical protein